MSYSVDVITSAGVALGEGPLRTASGFTRRWPLDEIGDVSFEIDAVDPQAALVRDADRPYVRAFMERSGTQVEIGRGIIMRAELQPTANEPQIALRGDDLTQELSGPLVDYTKLTNGSDGPMAAANVLPTLMAFLPSWSFVGAPSQDVYLEFANEQLLAALRKVCDQTGDHFYTVGRTLVWVPKSDTPVASGVRAVAVGDWGNPDTCIFEDLTYSRDAEQLVTRLRPYGAGQGKAQVTLQFTTRFGAPGTGVAGEYTSGDYTLHIDTNPLLCHIRYNPGETTKPKIERTFEQKDTSEIGTTTTDRASASNALFDACLVELKRRVKPLQTFTFSVVKLEREVLPGQTIDLEYVGYVRVRDPLPPFADQRIKWIDIDTRRDSLTLTVMELTMELDDDGMMHVAAFQVATSDRREASDERAQATLAIRQQSMNAHTQPAEIARQANNAATADYASTSGTVGDPTVAHQDQVNIFSAGNVFSRGATNVTGSATLTSSASVVYVNPTTGATTITLPSASDPATARRELTVKRIGSSVNSVTVSPPSGQNIDGSSSGKSLAMWEGMTFHSNGTNWFAIGRYTS